MPHFRKSLSTLMLLALPLSGWALEHDAQAAKDDGIRNFNLTRYFDAMPKLEVAAEAGDVEAMYYLGESNYRAHISYTSEAVSWYAQAAQRGDPYAMLRLYQGMVCKLGDREEWCPDEEEDWNEALMAQELPKAEAGDSEAMLVLHYLHYINSNSGQAKSWLEKAAEAGNPEAQNLLGKKILWDDLGWYWTEAGRQNTAEEWFRKAAEQGYVPAMNNLIRLATEQKNYGQVWEWVVRGSSSGFTDLRVTEGWCYLNPSELADINDGIDICGVDQEVVTGWAILKAMVDEADYETAKNIMERNQALLTSEQRKEALVLAKEEWLNREPPLSDYPKRYNPDI